MVSVLAAFRLRYCIQMGIHLDLVRSWSYCVCLEKEGTRFLWYLNPFQTGAIF